MGINTLNKYQFKSYFTLETVDFNTACTLNQPQQINGYRIYWIKKGKGHYHIDFESYEFDEEVLFFLSPNQIFSVQSESITEGYLLTFHQDFYCIDTHDATIACNGILFNSIYGTPLITPTGTDLATLNGIIQLLLLEFQNENPAKHDMLQTLLKQLIIHGVRIKNAHDTINTKEESTLLKDFSVLVEQNFKSIHSVTEYAKRLGISPKSLTKHLQKAGSASPGILIKNRILLEAKRQLIHSTATVKEIAYDLGFNDPAYFSRFFTKATQKSPSQFKAEFKN